MLKLQLLCACVLLSFLATAQVIGRQPSVFYARPPGDGKEMITSTGVNPATLAGIGTLQLSVYGERKFMIAELNVCRGIVGLPFGGGGLAASFDYFGNGAYGEVGFSAAYARKIGKAALGLNFHYQASGARGYKTIADVDGDLGMLIRVTPKFEAGLQLSNASTVLLKRGGDDNFPSISSIWRYSVSNKLALNASLTKCKGSDLAFNTCLYYGLTGRCAIRIGIALQPSEIFSAVAFRFDDLTIGIAVAYQSPLGLSPATFLQYHRPKE